MEQNDPQPDRYKNTPVAVKLAILHNHAEEVRRNNEIARNHMIEDQTIRDSLIHDQIEATSSLSLMEISPEERVASYQDLLQEYADVRGLQDLAELLDKATLLTPGTPFIPRELDTPVPRIVAEGLDVVQFVLRIAPGEDMVSPGLRILTTEGDQVVIGLRDEVGRDIIKSRLNSMTKGRNTTPTNKELRQCITYYTLIDDVEGVEYCRLLLARRKAASAVASQQV